MDLSMSATLVTDLTPPLDDAFDVFHARINRALLEPRHQGTATAGADADGLFTASADGLDIAVEVAGDVVTSAKYSGKATPAEQAVLELLCRFAIGATPRELVEHGLAFVVDQLRDPDAARPVEGILGPRNAGPCFQRPRGLVRALRETYISRVGDFSGDNIFDRPYSATWLGMPATEKTERLEALIQDYRGQTGLDETAMAVFEIDQYDRVVVMFGADVPVWDKPPHLLALERWLRQETGERIEVFVEIAKDSNRIRRL
jgi:hypothetical protein